VCVHAYPSGDATCVWMSRVVMPDNRRPATIEPPRTRKWKEGIANAVPVVEPLGKETSPAVHVRAAAAVRCTPVQAPVRSYARVRHRAPAVHRGAPPPGERFQGESEVHDAKSHSRSRVTSRSASPMERGDVLVRCARNVVLAVGGRLHSVAVHASAGATAAAAPRVPRCAAALRRQSAVKNTLAPRPVRPRPVDHACSGAQEGVGHDGAKLLSDGVGICPLVHGRRRGRATRRCSRNGLRTGG
jgi:hypothetical protein